MARQNSGFTLTMVLVAVFWTTSTAQTDCTNTIISLSPCLNYITGNSSTPASGCCTQLSSVFKSKPECLFQVLVGGGSSFGIQVNQTQAKALPAACNVQTPPLSSRNTASPTGSPAGTPKSETPSAASPTGSPAGTPKSATPSGMAPSTGSGSSDGSSTKMTAPLIFFLLIASYASIFTV